MCPPDAPATLRHMESAPLVIALLSLFAVTGSIIAAANAKKTNERWRARRDARAAHKATKALVHD